MASGNVAAASSGGVDWSQTSPAETERMKRATYQDVLDAPENKVAEILDGKLFLSPRMVMTVSRSFMPGCRIAKLGSRKG